LAARPCRAPPAQSGGMAAALQVAPRDTVIIAPMPTIFSHPAVAIGLPHDSLPRRVVIAGAIGSILPDVDVIGFAAGVPYSSTFGHRGFTHSILFALLASLLALWIVRPPRPVPAFAFLFACTLSHGLFDALTNGGLGVAFFSPFSNARYFFPWRPIQVSPIGPASLARLAPVVGSEVGWVWGPMATVAILRRILRRVGARSQGAAES
jgi:inner membrane protein